ncbi:uncharacterized protein LOC128496810 [Spea bombifrons]|uniref:uncharacterized protein LOC128496810 n=1 Tax=Spea bombifrons TaxID=233779 RepID=UPI0023491416|nr:uncharacterized protein LOC128496810 [Spea bombifrons]
MLITCPSLQTPVTFQEVAVCICEKRWKSLELKTKNLYTDILQDIHQTLTQLGHIILNPKTFIRVQDRDGHITKLSETPLLTDSENLQLDIDVKEEEADDIIVTKAGTGHSETDSENSELNIVIKNEDGEEIPISEQTQSRQSDGNTDSGLFPVNRKRGRPRIYSPEVAQRRKIEAERRRRNTRVTIGQAWPLWMSLRAEKGFTNERLAFYLIDTYRRVCESENSEAILGRKESAPRVGDYHGIEVTVGFSGEESSSSEEEKVNGVGST